jgi:hypothetical protein
MIKATVPIALPPAKKKAKKPTNPTIHLEITNAGFTLWNQVTYVECGQTYRFNNEVLTMPFFDQIYRYLTTHYATHRNNPIGAFLRPAIEAMEAARATRDGSSVYFAQAGNRIKIGWSRNVAQRITQLQTGNPEPVQLLATTPGARTLERQLHTRFAAARLTGEWFQNTPEIHTYIQTLNAQTG